METVWSPSQKAHSLVLFSSDPKRIATDSSAFKLKVFEMRVQLDKAFLVKSNSRGFQSLANSATKFVYLLEVSFLGKAERER